MKKLFSENKSNVWFWLFVGLAAVLLIAMPLMSLDAGNSGDEDKFQIPQGRFVMDYYHSDGQDTTCMKDVVNLKAITDGVIHDLSQLDPAGRTIHILHADCEQDAEWVRSEIFKAHPEVGEITISGLGVVIGAHCGPGLLTVFYLCDGRRPE